MTTLDQLLILIKAFVVYLHGRVAYRIREGLIALRREQARQIEITETEGDAS